MDSRPRKPFCLSSTRSSYTVSSPTVSSTLGSGSRLYGREPALSRDRLPRASSPYRFDLDKQSSRLLSSSREYGASEARSPSWKLPSLTSSSRSYDRPWAESPLSSRSKVTDPEGRLGSSSRVLDTSDDAESKRAKLLYRNRVLQYSRTASTSVPESTYCSTGLSGSRGAGETLRESLSSPWSSYRLRSTSSSSSSKPLLSSREQEVKNEPSFSGLGERRVRTPGLASLYQTDRVMSTYSQGARPKETTYSPSFPSFSSSSARESSLNQHVLTSASQHSTARTRDFSSGTSSRFRTGSPSRLLSQEQTSRLFSQEQTRCPDSSGILPSSSRTPWRSTPLGRPEATLPRLTPDVREPEGRSSTRRLLSRLFTRRSSQDSSSGSSGARSVEDDTPSTSGESVDSEEGARTTGVDADVAEATSDSLKNSRADLSPIQESSQARRRLTSRRESSVGSGGGSSSSWLSSSLRGRCPPLLSRLRRYAQSTPASEEGHSRPRRLPRQWDDLEQKTSPEEEDNDTDEEDEDEEEEGAVGVDPFSAVRGRRQEDETLPEPKFSPRSGVEGSETVSLGSAERRSETEEKLRKIKEKLLLEDSDEEEGDLCRICQMREESSSNPLIQPCRCTGSLQFVHQDCIKRWLHSKISSGSNLEAITTCELCKEKLRLNMDNFNISELYLEHQQSEYDELISSGLYLVVLLHFYEQRFSDVLQVVDVAGLFNLARNLQEYMDNLETPGGESDDEERDGRPSVDFSDLDDDLEEY